MVAKKNTKKVTQQQVKHVGDTVSDTHESPKIYREFLRQFQVTLHRYELAREKSVTQEEVGKLLDVGQSAVYNYLTLGRMPERKVLVRMERLKDDLDRFVEQKAPGDLFTPAASTTECLKCKASVPKGSFCNKCGAPLGQEIDMEAMFRRFVAEAMRNGGGK